MDRLVEAFERAATHAQRAGLPNQGLVAACGNGRFHGTMPVSELLAWQDDQDAGARRHPRYRANRAAALAMLGRFAEARSLLAELRAELAERGGGLMLAVADVVAGIEIELLAGDPAAAVAAGDEGCRVLEELGQESVLSISAGLLAQAYYALGRLEKADSWASRAAELGASDDAVTQMVWRQVNAKVLARRGEHAEAERLAREAVAIGEGTDLLNAQAEACADLAEVLAAGGRPEGAVEALEQALARYERKENLVMAERARARLAKLRPSETATPSTRTP